MKAEEISRRLRELKSLFDEGILDENEYRQEKKRLLSLMSHLDEEKGIQQESPAKNVQEVLDNFETGIEGALPPNQGSVGSSTRDVLDNFKTGWNGSSASELKEGSWILNRYRVERLLGRGGMGQVFLCRDKIDGQRYALKSINQEFSNNPDIRRRFLNEISILRKLTHQSIVRAYDLFEDPETKRIYYTMEYIEGETLEDYLRPRRQRGTLPLMSLEEIIDLISKLVEPLEYAHLQGVIHRDLKPANIMLLPDGSVKLMDFGIAKVLSSTHVTQHTGAIGTLSYMSPEQLKGKSDVTVAADIYSLGAIVYELLTNKLPLGRFLPPRQIWPYLPQKVEAVLLKALSIAPEERHDSVSDFYRALSEAVYGGPSSKLEEVLQIVEKMQNSFFLEHLSENKRGSRQRPPRSKKMKRQHGKKSSSPRSDKSNPQKKLPKRVRKKLGAWLGGLIGLWPLIITLTENRIRNEDIILTLLYIVLSFFIGFALELSPRSSCWQSSAWKIAKKGIQIGYVGGFSFVIIAAAFDYSLAFGRQAFWPIFFGIGLLGAIFGLIIGYIFAFFVKLYLLWSNSRLK